MYLSTANFLEYLKNTYSQKALGHFYVLSDKNLEQSKILLLKFFGHLKGGNEVNSESLHPDLTWISTEDDHFKLEDFSSALKTTIYKPYTLHYRFIIIEHAGKLSERVSNKLLKTLEEPEKFNIFFLLKTHGTPLLPTIHSRGVEINLYHDEGAPSVNEPTNLIDIFIEQIDRSELKNKKDKIVEAFKSFMMNKRSDESFLPLLSEFTLLEEILVQTVIIHLTAPSTSYNVGDELKIYNYEEHKKFHMNKEQRVLQLLDGLTLKT